MRCQQSPTAASTTARPPPGHGSLVLKSQPIFTPYSIPQRRDFLLLPADTPSGRPVAYAPAKPAANSTQPGTTAAINESLTSQTPPSPGNVVPLSLAPTSRLISD